MFSSKKPVVATRGIHLDFKGLPPTPKRLMELLDILKDIKVNCILAEYNSLYPWTNKKYRSKPCYPKAVISEFLAKAGELDIEVMPLVQCLGHFEMVLAPAEHAKFREIPENPGELCPLKKGARELVEELIDDIMETHKGKCSYFHLGGDEAWTMASCPECKKYVAKHSKSKLYLQHINPLLDRLAKDGMRPVLWADMMRHWPVADLKSFAKKADLMEWAYGAAPFQHMPDKDIPAIFKKAGTPLWGGSAYKGADGCMAIRPNLDVRTANNLFWADRVGSHNLKGVIMTAWSRYSDFTAQCESIDASLDALVMCAATLWDGKAPTREEAMKFIEKKLGKKAGKNILKLIEVSDKLQAWQSHLPAHIAATARHYPFNSEPERKNVWERQTNLKHFQNYIEDGKKMLAEWKKLHKDFVPEYWLEKFVHSQAAPMEKIHETFAKAK